MYAYYLSSHRYLSQDDINGIQSLYGPAPAPIASVIGSFCVDYGYTGHFSANITYGTSPFSYYWQKKYPCLDPFLAKSSSASVLEPECDTWVSSGSSESIDVYSTKDYVLRVQVTDQFGRSDWSPEHYVRVESTCYPGGNATMAEVADAASFSQLAADVKATSEIPEDYALGQSTPNPFSHSTEIRFDLPEAAHVRLAVYNLLGQEVRRLVDGEVGAGFHTATFEAGDLPSGVYLYRLTAGDFTQTHRMVLTK